MSVLRALRETLKKTSQRLIDRRFLWLLCILLMPLAPSWAYAFDLLKKTPDIRILGVSAELEKNVRSHLALSGEQCESPPWRVRRLFRGADHEIRTALRALGYYQPDIAKEFEAGTECWKAEFRIVPGDPVRLGQVSVELGGDAEKDPAFSKLLGDFPIKTGDVLNHEAYEDAKIALSKLAADRGYFDGRFLVTELRVNPGERQARASLVYDSGQRYRLGELRLMQDVLDKSLIAKFAAIPPDTAFESRHLVALHRSLYDSGYFSRVEVRPDIDAAEDGVVPIQVSVEPKKKHQFSAGVGAATDTGPRLSLGYTNRRVNRKGHSFEAKTSISPVKNSVGIDYQIPKDDPQRERITFTALYSRESTDTTDNSRIAVGAADTKKRPSDWLETRFLELSREDYEIAGRNNTAVMLVPGLSWSKGRADGKIPTGRGFFFSTSVRGAAETVASETNLLQLRANWKWIDTLPGRIRLLTRAEIGTSEVGDFEALPSTYRFFAGGDYSVRGYGYKKLGPKNSDGEVVGGRHLLVGSVELQYPIRKGWHIAAFVDGGNAIDGLDDPLKAGAGLGVRWQSPIGPVRLYLAHPFDGDASPLRIHFVLGPDV